MHGNRVELNPTVKLKNVVMSKGVHEYKKKNNKKN